MEEKRKTSVVFFPIPGAGHLISTVVLAKQLLLRHPFSITILTMHQPIAHPETATYIDSITSSFHPDTIRFQGLPPLDPPLPTDESHKFETFISLLIDRHKPLVRAAIANLLPVAGLVMDFFATAMIDVAVELSIPPYIYFSSSASTLGLMLYLPTLHLDIPSELNDVEGDIVLPGLPLPVPPLSMPTAVMDKKDQAYQWLLHHGRRFAEASGGIIVNTFLELEPTAVRGLEDGFFLPDRHTPPVYHVGPLLKLELKSGPENECIQWLDNQPLGSVVFLCFGSRGSLTPAQVKEAAVGLERSGHRFLWSLRNPQVLPEGFLERTNGRGMVWPGWAPQVEVLGHRATGAFVTHCGWNSCLESLWFGVPMVAWPMYAEQHFNAFEMARDLGVAVELRLDRRAENFVAAEELERAVRCLMEAGGREEVVKGKLMEMMEAGRRALVKGGSSFASFQRLTEKLTTWD